LIIFICFSLLLGILKEYTFDFFSSDDDDDEDDVSDMDIDSSEESDQDMEDVEDEEPDIDEIESGRSKLNEAQLEHNKGTPPKDNASLGELQEKYSKELKNTDSVQDFLDNVDKRLTSDVEIIKKKYNFTEEELAESEEDQSKDESKDESKDKSEAEKKNEGSDSTRGSGSSGSPFGGSGSSGPPFGGSAPSGSSGTSTGPSQGSSSGGTLSKVKVGVLGLLGSLSDTISNFF
jgi:hypothetical protein